MKNKKDNLKALNEETLKHVTFSYFVKNINEFDCGGIEATVEYNTLEQIHVFTDKYIVKFDYSCGCFEGIEER